MKRNKLYYYKTGSRIARRVFHKDIVLFLKYLVFLVASAISKALIILEPIFELGHCRLLEEIFEHEEFKIEKIFDDANSPKKYWNSLMLYLIKMSILISGIWIIYKITEATVNLGIQMDEMTNLDYYIIQYIFLIPGIIIGVLFIVLVGAKFAPTPYIIKNHEDIMIGEVMHRNFTLMNNRGIVSLLTIYVLNIIKIVVWGILGYMLVDFTYTQFDFIITSMVKIIISLVLIRIIIEKVLAAKLSSALLFEDLMITHTNTLENEEEIDDNERKLITLFESLPSKTNTDKNDKGEE